MFILSKFETVVCILPITPQVTVVITRGNITMRDTSGVVLLNHTVKQIHKCVMEQADHTCFLYTLKPSDKDLGLVSGAPGYVAASDPTVPVPANFSVDQNYQCHLLQAENEQEVRNAKYYLIRLKRNVLIIFLFA